MEPGNKNLTLISSYGLNTHLCSSYWAWIIVNKHYLKEVSAIILKYKANTF